MQTHGILLDILWITLCGVLVFLMQAGFLCLESGVTRSKNAINVAMKNAADFAVAVFLFWLLGFGLMFGGSFQGLIGTDFFAPDLGQGDAWTAAFFLFQAMFCTTAVTIVSGAVAERVRFSGYLLICVLTVTLIYPFSGHWAWGGLILEQQGWLSARGFVDFAGSTVVHSVGGWVALAAVLVVGARQGRFVDGELQAIPASNAPLACLGVLFFVVGWIGFNGGSTLALNSQVPGIILNTILAAVSGAIAAYLLLRYKKNIPGNEWFVPLNGCLAGLVAITANCHAVSSGEAVLIGAVGALVMVAVDSWMLKHQLDDAIGAVPVHLGAGIWGTLAVAIFGDPAVLGTGLSTLEQLQVQLQGIISIGLWSFLVALAGISIINRISPLRVSAEDEQDGLNVSEHGARTDLIDLLRSMDVQQQTVDLDHRVPVEPFTEVGQIAAGYNRVMNALADAVNQTRAIVHDIRDAIVTFGEDGLLTSFNPGAEVIFGLPAHNAIGQSVTKLVNITDTDAIAINQIPLNQPREILGKRFQSDPFYMEVTLTKGLINGTTQYTALCRDIHEKRRVEEQLYREKEQALVTLSSIADGVITTDQSGRVVYLNSAAEQLTGWTQEQATGQPCVDVFQLLLPTSVTSAVMLRKALSGQTIRVEADNTVLFNRNGDDHAITHTAAPIKNRKGHVFGCIIVFHDVSSTRNMQKQLSHQATHDALTGLFNRTGFEKIAANLIENAKSLQQGKEQQHILGYLDLDQFKLVNDSCGHVAGDELLRQVATVIAEQLRSGDTIARLGGDEFGILLHNCPQQKALEIGENIRQAIQQFRFPWQGRHFAIGVSIGLVQINAHSPNLPKLLSLADSACYAAKDQGRNRVNLYEPDDKEMAIRRGQIQWVSKIRHALDFDKFRLFYQSIVPVDPAQGQLKHIEMFVRMIDDDGSIIPPGAFIPAAERYNLIQEIDLWVLKNALAWIGDNAARAGDDFYLCALNISGPSISDDTCLREIMGFFDRYKVPGNKVCFEITETAAISNLESARKFFRALKNKGCKFALDDFGAGLSSFGYLKTLPVDYLKIDGSFIKDIHNNSVDSVMVQAINTIGHEMGLKTIAEFVESQDILDHLQTLGVDYAQGYHIDKPASLENLASVAFMPR
ncbi:ammonium transporter [Pseudomaricurvus alcaniphilus]|uniref:ammonium transporter n=1 Tax=Pseudomaricurvus alcaniphilus TaxID=1166482 RepID=UPI00140DDFB1|nr:ammonium transporter [Pseudomaricurvus alcaniphilus]NHN37233.1 ammonium transporter [Pseudomaricurvus alcaniphilus]